MDTSKQSVTLGLGLLFMVLSAGLWFVLSHPTSGMEADGGFPGREIVVTILGRSGETIPGVAATEVHEDALRNRELSRHPVEGRTGPNGSFRFAADYYGTSSSTRTYLWGLWEWTKYSGAGTYGTQWRFLWGLFDVPTAKSFTVYVFSHDGKEIARIRKDDVLRLPVTERIPLSESLFVNEPNASYFTRNGEIEVSRLSLQIE